MRAEETNEACHTSEGSGRMNNQMLRLICEPAWDPEVERVVNVKELGLQVLGVKREGASSSFRFCVHRNAKAPLSSSSSVPSD